MLGRIFHLPLVVILVGLCSISMIFPAIDAYLARDLHVARTFFYGSVLFMFLTTMVAVATQGYEPRSAARSHLIALVATFAGLPIILAIPVVESLRNTTFLNAYFEMVSSLTTTGATVFDDPNRLPRALHLWRAEVAWLGGFFMWVTAFAILQPMRLGGFEVTPEAHRQNQGKRFTQFEREIDPSRRLVRVATTMFPLYLALTSIIWMLLVFAGENAHVALIHAMSTISTSGISSIGGLANGESGFIGELVIFVFLALALSRRTILPADNRHIVLGLRRDPELRMAGVLIIAVPLLFFMRHWIAAIEIHEGENIIAAARALWGTAFEVMSFLTTSGFVSAFWGDVRAWSGIETPGIALMALAIMGGGVATTAGGIKLLRVYALYKHGAREMQRLVYPSSVGGAGADARLIRRDGAIVAWLFFMLSALSLAAVMMAFSMTGLDFEASMIFASASLSTTGPLVSVAGETALAFSDLTSIGKIIAIGAMILGRLETLVIIALLNPAIWRS